ncbi:hypothetical protein BDZ45DRAFT_250361 [Acephala macrosclerotiorum]|nr:hypothetical protein BDZ45DRAFT_250361 [Acephala macrosclerotiorum]
MLVAALVVDAAIDWKCSVINLLGRRLVNGFSGTCVRCFLLLRPSRAPVSPSSHIQAVAARMLRVEQGRGSDVRPVREGSSHGPSRAPGLARNGYRWRDAACAMGNSASIPGCPVSPKEPLPSAAQSSPRRPPYRIFCHSGARACPNTRAKILITIVLIWSSRAATTRPTQPAQPEPEPS